MPFVTTPEIERALELLRSGSHLFLTGKAGTGKSTLVRHFMAATDRNVVVAAPTGIAALNVDGYTIHRLFSLAPTSTPESVRGPHYFPGRFASTLRGLDTLIIDEASMVRADVFDMVAAALERFGPRPGQPFGGVQLVLVGDLFQLPPVVPPGEAAHFESRYATPYFFSADAFDREQFPTVALTTVFRQLGDDKLTSILNAIREGVLVDQAQRDLNERTDPDFEPPDDELWLTLAPTNRMVTARNRARLARLPGEEVVSHAVRTGDLATFDAPAEDALTFKVGAQVMMLANDPGDRWVNGTLARVAWADVGDDGQVTAGIELPGGAVETVHPHTWDATRPVLEAGTLRREVVGTFTQLPFRLAWAVTIHKAQGQTLDRLVVDLTGGVFDYGQVYVALSRCTSMAGLVLTRPVHAKDLRTDRRVLRFLRAATSSGPVRHCAVGILTVGDEGRLSRPRPVEIAVAFDDGTAVSTLVNPHRDLGAARRDFGITVDDVLLAPSLPEAWAVLGPLLDGCTPVGVGTDLALGIIDFELKRLGHVTPLPLGIELAAHTLLPEERAGLTAPSALERARAALAVHRRSGPSDDGGGGAFVAPASAASGYLLTRDPDASPPTTALTPTLSALLTASRAMSEVVLHGVRAGEVRARFDGGWQELDPHGPAPTLERLDVPGGPSAGPHGSSSALDDPLLREVVAARLASAVERSAGVPSTLLERVRELEDLLDTSILGPGFAAGADAGRLEGILVPGARVCFTGTVHDPDGRFVDKGALERLVTSLGLRWAPGVSKSRCDALVVAEVGTQSGKARKAKEYGKPVISAAEFFTWALERHPAPTD